MTSPEKDISKPFKSSLRILLVEDDKAVAQGFKTILEDAGYNVIGIAYNGLEAVEKTAELNPNMILMDIKMPVLDGLEAAR